jgi:hypothetical protein
VPTGVPSGGLSGAQACRARHWRPTENIEKYRKTGGQGRIVRAYGEDKDFKSYLLLAKRAGGYYFRNF